MNGLGMRTPLELPMGINVAFMTTLYSHCGHMSMCIFSAPTPPVRRR
jgi:hypothetical protein